MMAIYKRETIVGRRIFVGLILVFLLGIFFIFLLAKRASPPFYSYYFSRVSSKYPCQRAFVSDIDQDGADEIIVYGGESSSVHKFVVLNSEMRIIFQATSIIPQCRNFNPLPPINVDEDPELEIPFCSNDDISTCLSVIDFTLAKGGRIFQKKIYPLKKVIGIDTDRNGLFDGGLFISKVTDLDRDSKKEIVYLINTGRDDFPRLIIFTDQGTGKEIWRFPLGPHIWRIKTLDIDKDGLDEILVGTRSPMNGRIYSGIDDEHPYAIVLKINGSILWKRRFARGFGTFDFFPGDFNGDGKKELFGVLCREGTGPPFCEGVFLMDPLTGDTLDSWHPPEGRLHSISVCKVVDINDDGRDELLVGLRDGNLMKVDIPTSAPNALRAQSILNVKREITYIEVSDLTNNGSKEIILIVDGNTLQVYDNKLRIIAFYEQCFPINNFNIVSPGEGLQKRIGFFESIISPKTEEAYFVQYKLEKSLPKVLPFPTETFFIFLSLFALFLFAFYLLRKDSFYRTRLAILQKLGTWWKRGVIVLNKEGNVLFTNPKTHKLIDIPFEGLESGDFIQATAQKEGLRMLSDFLASFLQSKEKKNRTELSLGDQRIEVKVEREGDKLFIFLEEKEETYKVYYSWAKAIQSLIHKIKNSLNNITLGLTKINEDSIEILPKNKEIFDILDKERERLKKHLISLSRLTSLIKEPIFEIVDINSLVRETLLSFPIRKEISLNVNLEKDLPPIYVDQEKIVELIKNLLENAMKAIKGKGVIDVSTFLLERLPESPKEKLRRYVCIRIADNGCGISEENLGRIFDPNFSTFEEGLGLGLTIVKYIVEAHQGEIHVESKVGLGTTFSVCLPISGEVK
jgi:signal transduction histidine kinase